MALTAFGGGHVTGIGGVGACRGQVGYVVMGMKTPQEAHIGDTLLDMSSPGEPLPGFLPSKPMVCCASRVVPHHLSHPSVASLNHVLRCLARAGVCQCLSR